MGLEDCISFVIGNKRYRQKMKNGGQRKTSSQIKCQLKYGDKE